jgi:hypothetical protein
LTATTGVPRLYEAPTRLTPSKMARLAPPYRKEPPWIYAMTGYLLAVSAAGGMVMFMTRQFNSSSTGTLKCGIGGTGVSKSPPGTLYSGGFGAEALLSAMLKLDL